MRRLENRQFYTLDEENPDQPWRLPAGTAKDGSPRFVNATTAVLIRVALVNADYAKHGGNEAQFRAMSLYQRLGPHCKEPPASVPIVLEEDEYKLVCDAVDSNQGFSMGLIAAPFKEQLKSAKEVKPDEAAVASN